MVGPLLLSGSELRGSRWPRWLAYFGMLGAGFMLIEVALLQRFVLLLGHPVYSLTVTLFSVLLGTGIGSLVSRRITSTRALRADHPAGAAGDRAGGHSWRSWRCRRSSGRPSAPATWRASR